MKLGITVLIPLFLLTACAQGNSRAVPDVVSYTQEQQTQAAEELETNNVPTLTEFMKDYKVMRDQTRYLKEN